MSMTTNKENTKEEVMENKTMEIEVIDTPVEESKIKKIWNKAKKPLAFVAIAAAAFGGGFMAGKTVSGGSDQEDQDTEENVEE